MNAINELFVATVVILILSYALGLAIYRDPKKAWKIPAKELKLLSKVGRWLLRRACLMIGNIFHSAAKALGEKKKPKTTP